MGMLRPVSVGPQQINRTTTPKSQKIKRNNRKHERNDKLCEFDDEGHVNGFFCLPSHKAWFIFRDGAAV